MGLSDVPVSFARVYRDNLWSGSETRSGPGSSLASTAWVAEWLVGLVRVLGVQSVLDAGCGEGYWMPLLPGYAGVDAVLEAVEAARRLHGERVYLVRDVRTDPLPRAELVFTRDFLQHLPVDDGLLALENLRSTGARWLIASTYRDGDNAAGPETPWHAYRVNLEAWPFALGPPALRVIDGYDEAGVLRDEAKCMGLWKW